MQYLEDFLEILESVPPEIRYITNQMRLNDVSLEESENLHKKIESFMEVKDIMTPEQREAAINEIRSIQHEHTNKANIRCDLVKKLRTIFDLYKNRFEEDLRNYKLELEAEAPGVTETIENRYNENQRLSRESGNLRRTNGYGIENLVMYYPDGEESLIYNSDCEVSRSSMGGQTPRHNSHGDIDIPPQLFDKLSQQGLRDRSSTFTTKLEDSETNPTKRRRTIATLPTMNTSNTKCMTDFTEAWFRGPSGAITPNFCMSPNTINTNKVSLGSYQDSNQVPFDYKKSRNGRQSRLSNKSHEIIGDNGCINESRRGSRYSSRHTPDTPSFTSALNTCNNNLINREHTPASVISLSDDEESEIVDEEDEEEENDNRIWCKCREKSYGLMVKCDNDDCEYRWFHGDCVGITPNNKPSINEKWLCQYCQQRIRNIK
uniref:Inhibitor of growth protein n=1 Tax=Strongyloides venezuelensis TaxID=75913 RepID=A0A0K0G0X9_STRVS